MYIYIVQQYSTVVVQYGTGSTEKPSEGEAETKSYVYPECFMFMSKHSVSLLYFYHSSQILWNFSSLFLTIL